MRSLVKSIHYSTLTQLASAAKQITKEQYRFQQLFKEIVFSAFGNQEHQGLIAQRIDYYYAKTPINWAEELDSLVKIFSPGGEIMNGCGQHGLLATADHTISIDPRVLPKSVLDEFTGSADKQSTMLRSLKRQFGDKFYISSWEWFWVHLAHAMLKQPELQQRRSVFEDQEEDQLYFMLCRNPYLMIARKAMQHTYRRDSFLLERMRGVLELYVIEELLFATKARSGRVDVKYQLKSQHFGLIFLLINSQKGKLTGETIEVYEQYFLKVTEHYSTITNHSHNKNVKNILRMWVYLLTRDYSLDSNIIKQLQNANPQDGWYHLSRCPFEDWAKAIKRVTIPASELPTVISVRKNIYRLLAKHNEWNSSFSFLAALQQYLEFEQTIFHKYVRKHSEKQDDIVITRAFERILIHLVQNGANPQSLNHVQERLNLKYKARLAKDLTVNFNERSSEARQILSRSSREKAKSISYQSPRIRNVWEHPIQQNEFQLFFNIAFWIAQQFDKPINKLISAHSRPKYPRLNIRIIANPFVFILILFILAFSIRWLLS